MSTEPKDRTAEWYAQDFISQLRLGKEVEHKCEWSCLLWSKDYWAIEAQRRQVELQQAKDNMNLSQESKGSLEVVFSNSQFLNTVARVYSRFFGGIEHSCTVKSFPDCPFMGERAGLLQRGSLASVFVTILHKAVSYAMLDKHPLDSGLYNDEYNDVYGIQLTDFRDLEVSLRDGRFAILYENVLRRAREFAGIPNPKRDWIRHDSHESSE
jgi:hypothetical protein